MKRDWTAGMAAVACTAAVAAAGGLWALWAVSPALFALAALWTATTGLCVWAATRNLRAELATRDARLDAYDLSAQRTDLDLVGPASPPAGVRMVGSGDITTAGRLRVREGATGWLGPDDVSFERPPVRLVDHDPEGQSDRVVTYDSGITVEPAGHLEWVDLSDRVVDAQVDPGRCLPMVAPPESFHDRMRRILAELHGDEHIGQSCAECGNPAGSWVAGPEATNAETFASEDLPLADRPWIVHVGGVLRLVTFLCDDHYAAAMAAEHESGA